MQAQLDADGFQIKVWDPTADGGIGSGDGYDGWYNPDFCKSELAIAVEELGKDGITVSKENPIQIDYPYVAWTTTGPNRANAVKQSIEAASEGLIQINLVACNNTDEYYDNSYYTTYGYEQNTDLNTSSGWGPDYGDPSTYLDTFAMGGYMLKLLGIF
jgi:ABC-type oligopeptide transport system substrate-binding subunit